MPRLRPIRERDLPGLVALTRSIQGGLTSLPPDEDFLRDRIDDSHRAFAPRIRKPGAEFYLFVLEDEETGDLLGTSGLAARVGGFEPFYTYERRVEVHAHPPLGIAREVAVLHPKRVHQGPTELCSLFLKAGSRRAGLGRLLSFGRFLFMAAFPERFTSTVIAELRGYADPLGRSPFWEAVGRHFYGEDFASADRLSGLGHKDYIANLMPAHPIYVPLLPPEAQAAIGRVHPETEPAWAMLHTEGFAPTEEVDLFDAGPLVRAEVAALRSVRLRRVGRLREIADRPPDGPLHLLSAGGLDFRATLGTVRVDDAGNAILDAATVRALECREGDPVAWIPLR